MPASAPSHPRAAAPTLIRSPTVRAPGLETNGFSFDGTDTGGMDYALNRALSLFYSDRAFWNSLAERVMHQDWSWDGPSLDYIELYYKARKGL